MQGLVGEPLSSLQHLVLEPTEGKTAAWLLVVAISILSLASCDQMYGIAGRKVVSQAADDTCISGALRRTPGVKDVREEKRTNEGWLLVGDGPFHGSIIRYFTYDIGIEYRPTLEIEDFGSGQFAYSSTMLQLNKSIPQKDINIAFPIIVAAEKHVSEICRIDIGGMKHDCLNSRCEFEDHFAH